MTADTAIDRLTRALEQRGVRLRRTTGGNWSGKCPAHDGQGHTSLSVRGIEGRALVHCFAGCAPADVAAAVGLELADLFDERSGQEYRYTDAAGRRTRTVHRSPDKGFRQSGRTNVRQLYRLPRVVEAVTAGQPVYLVEGEQDVHTLESLGVVATTAPEGAANVNRCDFGPLKGADVIAVADRDAPGAVWAATVRNRLRGHAKSLHVVQAKDGKDVTDHVLLGHGLADLVPVDGGWDEPLPVGWRTDLPPFPVDALPPVLRRYVEAMAAEVQTPVDLFAVPVLGVLAACIGGRVRIELRRGYMEPTNGYFVPVAPPASRKSAAIAACREPLDDAEALAKKATAGQIQDATVRHSVLAQRADKAQADAVKAGTDQAIAEAQAAMKAAAEAVPAVPPRLVIGDAGPERLVNLLSDHGRLASISAEAGAIDALTGARHGKKTNLDPLLKAHAGDRIDNETLARGAERADRPALTLVMSIQPYALAQITRTAESAGRGLTARMLWSLVPDIVGTRTWAGSVPAADAVKVGYHTAVCDLALYMALLVPVDDKDIVLTLDDAAGKVLGEFHDRIEQLMAPGAEHGSGLIREWAGKLVGAVGRIAAGLHVASYPPPAPQRHGLAGTYDLPAWSPGPVGETTMRSAISVGSYFLGHAAAALSGGEAKHAKASHELLTWLKTRRMASFRLRDVLRGGPAHLRKAEAVQPVVAYLVDLGWFRATEGGYDVNPSPYNPATPATPATGDDSDDVPTAHSVAGVRREPSQPSATPATDPHGDVMVSQPSQPSATPEQAKRGPLSSTNANVSQMSQVSQDTCPRCTWPSDSNGHAINCKDGAAA